MVSRLKIGIITPTVAQTATGNVMTAVRYARIFKQLGHRPEVVYSYDGQPFDVLIALHARRSHASIQAFADRRPDRPLVVVLTGTDLYQDIKTDADAQRSLELATRLVVLQRAGLVELPAPHQAKTWVIYQSAQEIRASVQPPSTYFRVSVIGHLRPEKDPFRTALAARRLPAASRMRVLHIGHALSPEMEEMATRETATNPRYRWQGGLPYWRTRQLLAASHLTAITSLMEGSSNVLCEALTTPVPVAASRISGLIGTLADDYAGYFPVEDTEALADLLWKAESDPAFYDELRTGCARVAPLVHPDNERNCWADLLADVTS